MKHNTLLILLLSPILLFASCNFANSSENYDTPIEVGGNKLMVEVVNTNDSRSQGLSGRNTLSDENGMLFDFTNSSENRPSFWMKDMKFDIDIIWIYNDRIVDITEDVPTTFTNVNLPSYSPSTDITHVLEVPAGWSERNKINVGDKITY